MMALRDHSKVISEIDIGVLKTVTNSAGSHEPSPVVLEATHKEGREVAVWKEKGVWWQMSPHVIAEKNQHDVIAGWQTLERG